MNPNNLLVRTGLTEPETQVAAGSRACDLSYIFVANIDDEETKRISSSAVENC